MSSLVHRPPSFGKNIETLRYLAGVFLGKTDAQGELKELTQEEFGRLIGSLLHPVKQTTVVGWEKRKRVPEGGTIARILEIFDIDERSLFSRDITALGSKNRVREVWMERKSALAPAKRVSRKAS